MDGRVVEDVLVAGVGAADLGLLHEFPAALHEFRFTFQHLHSALEENIRSRTSTHKLADIVQIVLHLSVNSAKENVG